MYERNASLRGCARVELRRDTLDLDPRRPAWGADVVLSMVLLTKQSSTQASGVHYEIARLRLVWRRFDGEADHSCLRSRSVGACEVRGSSVYVH